MHFQSETDSRILLGFFLGGEGEETFRGGLNTHEGGVDTHEVAFSGGEVVYKLFWRCKTTLGVVQATFGGCKQHLWGVSNTWVCKYWWSTPPENPSMFSMHYNEVECHNNGVHALAEHASLTANH